MSIALPFRNSGKTTLRTATTPRAARLRVQQSAGEALQDSRAMLRHLVLASLAIGAVVYGFAMASIIQF